MEEVIRWVGTGRKRKGLVRWAGTDSEGAPFEPTWERECDISKELWSVTPRKRQTTRKRSVEERGRIKDEERAREVAASIAREAAAAQAAREREHRMRRRGAEVAAVGKTRVGERALRQRHC